MGTLCLWCCSCFKVYEALVKGKNLTQAGVPESFRVLIKEFQALGLDISIIDNNDEIHDLTDLEESDDDAPITIDEIDVNKDNNTEVTPMPKPEEFVPDEENNETEDEFESDIDEMPTDEELEKISNGDIEGDEI